MVFRGVFVVATVVCERSGFNVSSGGIVFVVV